MNMNFKFRLGDKVVVPHVAVTGAIEGFRVYLDKSILVHVRWAMGDSLHADWFTEKELKAPKAEKKKATIMPQTRKPKKKRATRRGAPGNW